ncbi:MAG: ImmA/IrrE family metallo-endopeptidase [Prevotellaceae bacterium]|jgi:Zn-dependent peptidase ImmA (M78 family)|nr:ImmA/IrrE family metallo-endopeptidase [Prevotellaceae bacterium]
MANHSNTVAKGDAFEDKVFVKFKELLELGALSLDSNNCRIYQKKSYRGRSGNDIEFDISIEVFMPNTTECSHLILIECKDYKSPIQVNKITDFSHKINDVGGNKGLFITTSKFHQGGVNIARQERIGLAILNNSNNIDWKLPRIGKQKYQIRQEIETYFTDTNSSNEYQFVGIFGNSYFISWSDFLSDAVGCEVKLPFKIDYLSNENIEDKIFSLFEGKNINSSDYFMSTDDLIDFATNNQNLKLDFNSNLKDELGFCDFQNKQIGITNDLEYNSPRWRFTLAHEIGHWALHYYLFENYGVLVANDDKHTIEINENSIKRLEIQANMFASRLLVPTNPLWTIYNQLHKKEIGRRFPILYVDNQPINQKNFHIITQKLGERFGVSKKVIENRLLELKVLQKA